MFRLFAGAFALALLALTGAVRAEDKKTEETTWVRDVEGVDLVFKVGKDTAQFIVAIGENGITVSGKLTAEKDTVTFEITEVKEKGEFPNKPKKGEKFTFKWVVKDDKATISDLKGDIADDAKPVVAGEYKKKK